MKFLLGVGATLAVIVIAAWAVMSSGRLYVGADKPHGKLMYALLETTRERAITHASKDILVPELDKAEMFSAGGADYNDMCAGCHLAPGVDSTDLSSGLSPAPPNFTDAAVVARFANEAGAKRSFWSIKHGIMASGMPAWGASHEDERIWAMVAFIKKLPELNKRQYAMLTTRFDADALTEMDADMEMGH